jgi:hypothetical protein
LTEPPATTTTTQSAADLQAALDAQQKAAALARQRMAELQRLSTEVATPAAERSACSSSWG